MTPLSCVLRGRERCLKVRDYGTLVVESSDFANNVAERGGAIQVGYSGRLTVRSSTFDGNGGSVSEDGFSAGAIATFSSGVGDTKDFLNIQDSTISNNSALKQGGAVWVDSKGSVTKDAFALLDNKVLLQASNIAVEAFNNDNNFVAA
ncbi:MAG: hypothetical protein ACFB5Z_19420 [Elainellaceae cyanobacterium]